MKQMLSRDINLGIILVVLFVIAITGGFLKWPLFILYRINFDMLYHVR